MKPALPVYGNKLVVASAFVIAFICSLHHWTSLVVTRGDYTPFSVSPAVSALTFDESHAYAPPARRFMATGKLKAEVDNYEHRDFSAAIPYLPAVILGAAGRVSGSLEWSFILADFFFPGLLFLLFYRISGELISEKLLRVLNAAGSILIPFGFKNAFWAGDDALTAPLEITRTPQPEISLLFLLIASICLARTLETVSAKRVLIAGVASGSVVYSYFFFAAAWSIALCILLGLAMFWRDRKIALAVAATIALTLSVAMPYVLAGVRGRVECGELYLLGRMGAYTHHPDWWPLLTGAFLVAILFVSGRRLRRACPAHFVLLLVIAGSLLGMNLQVITGYETQTWHFWKRLAVPLAFFVVASAGARLHAKRKAVRNAIVVALTVLIMLNAAARQVCSGLNVATVQRASNPEMAMLRWIRENTPQGNVIGTVEPQLIFLLPAVTADYNYVPAGIRSLTSTREIVERYDSLACLMNLSADQVQSDAEVPSHLHRSTLLLQTLGLSYNGDPGVLRWFVDQYKTGRASCGALLGRLDYVVLPAHATGLPPKLEHLFGGANVIYRNRSYQLVALRR